MNLDALIIFLKISLGKSFSTLKSFELISEYLIHDIYSGLEQLGPNMGWLP